MSAFADLPISRKLMAAFAAVVAIIFVSSAIVYDRLRVIEDAKNWRVHTADVLDTLRTALDAMLDQETGVRGYLISGDDRFLDPYQKGGVAFIAALRKMKELTSRNPAQQNRFDDLNELAKKWRSGIANREIALMARPETREDARALEGSGAGKAAMDLIRAKVYEIETVERDLLAKRDAVQDRAFATAYSITILGGAASLIIATLMGVLLTRGITVPITRMTSAMATLAEGDTSVEVPGVGRSDEIGAMAAAVQVFRNSIIDRKLAEEALRDSEEKWRAVFENNPTMYFTVDAGGTVLSVNPFGAEQLGYTVDELTGASVLNVFHEADRAAVQRHTTRCIEHLGRTMTWELRKVRKDGSMLWVRETARAMLMKGDPVVLIVCEDITDRKRAEQELMASEARFRTFVDHATDAFMLHSEDGAILDANRQACESLGYTRDELIGMTPMDFDPDVNEASKQRLSEWFEAGEILTFEGRHRRKDGTVFPVEVRVREFIQNGQRLALTLVRDITERKRAAEALREMQMELAHVNRVTTMGQLTAAIAHEVNQPIAAAVTNAHAAFRWLSAEPPNLDEVREALGRIVENGGRAGDVIGRIRALIKKAPQRQDRFDLNEAILDVIALARSEVLRHGVSLQTQLATSLPSAEGDRIQLQQVILNLILNAVEAMSGIAEGPRELQISTGSDASNGVLVAVRDSGPGLDPKSADRLFDPFYTTKPDGMGMGLAICRSIIEAHGGRLWASANEPRGASFQFTLPAERAETVPAAHAGQMPVV